MMRRWNKLAVQASLLLLSGGGQRGRPRRRHVVLRHQHWVGQGRRSRRARWRGQALPGARYRSRCRIAHLARLPERGKNRDGTAVAVYARDRIGEGPWHNAKGEMIAKDVAQLHGDNNLTKETALNERGEVVNGHGDTPNRHDILTGSTEDGRPYSGVRDLPATDGQRAMTIHPRLRLLAITTGLDPTARRPPTADPYAGS